MFAFILAVPAHFPGFSAYSADVCSWSAASRSFSGTAAAMISFMSSWFVQILLACGEVTSTRVTTETAQGLRKAFPDITRRDPVGLQQGQHPDSQLGPSSALFHPFFGWEARVALLK